MFSCAVSVPDEAGVNVIEMVQLSPAPNLVGAKGQVVVPLKEL